MIKYNVYVSRGMHCTYTMQICIGQLYESKYNFQDSNGQSFLRNSDRSEFCWKYTLDQHVFVISCVLNTFWYSENNSLNVKILHRKCRNLNGFCFFFTTFVGNFVRSVEISTFSTYGFNIFSVCTDSFQHPGYSTSKINCSNYLDASPCTCSNSNW